VEYVGETVANIHGSHAHNEHQVEEFPAVSSTDIAKAMAELAGEPTTLMFHAEMAPPISDSAEHGVQHSLPPLAPVGPLNAYNTFLASRPPSFETRAVEEIISLAPLAPHLPLHIVHLSALQAIPILREARAAGIRITAETCFHYLSLAAESIRDGDTRHKCCPPIRGQNNQDALWAELLRRDDPVIKTVVSDHSPCTPDLKLLPYAITGPCNATSPEASGDFFSAWGGVSSVGLGISILWTEGQKRGVMVEDIVRWCCRNTAYHVGLEHQKGDLRVGMDGDVAVFDDEAWFEVQEGTMLFKNKCSPYQGKKLQGVVLETWLRGRKVHSRIGGFDRKVGPTGKLLLEPRRLRS
jgi:allantoinase